MRTVAAFTVVVAAWTARAVIAVIRRIAGAVRLPARINIAAAAVLTAAATFGYVNHATDADNIDTGWRPALGGCQPAGPTRFATYWAFAVTCTSGTGGVRSHLVILTRNGVALTDYGPCSGKFTPSAAYVTPSWLVGGMTGSRVYVANWSPC
jgi:hypothetical protein